MKPRYRFSKIGNCWILVKTSSNGGHNFAYLRVPK